jgi:hypothetical protein
MSLDHDEYDFLWQGINDIKEVMFKLLRASGRNLEVESRSIYLFSIAFHQQVEEKQGLKPMNAPHPTTTAMIMSQMPIIIPTTTLTPPTSTPSPTPITTVITAVSPQQKCKQRLKFSRRKQFVVACVYQALKETGIHTWNIKGNNI